MDSSRQPSQAPPGSKAGLPPSQERRHPPPQPGRPSAQGSAQQQLQTQDWVNEQPEGRRVSRRWSVSIDDRRRLAVLGGLERAASPGASAGIRDIAQVVAQLVSEDVDRDVLISHPPRSAESTNAFRAFLARSAPFWQNSTQEQ
ncbi:testis-expressed protein 22 [Dasypus novemcinctus]|uniref:testis-expressed protein 22 n=1 Tax=Dasypus novemcinctus TaxID=9361 RepID=UPI000328DE9D|nr:testis-expressed protein 22 [Dasypus novemcinctus]